MKNKVLIFSLFFIFNINSFILNAANRYVSVNGDGNGLSWSSPKGLIQSAIQDCVAGDTVFVSSGTYSEAIAIKDGVHIMGGYHPVSGLRDIEVYTTILDGQGLGRYLIVKYDSPCVYPTTIEGFTISNAEHSNEGGGAYIRGNVILSKCYFLNCKGSNGGGVFSNGGVIKDCIIELCSATSSGGAIRNSGGIVENTIILGNKGKYGTIRNENNGIVRNCILYNNSATVPGWPNSGGIYNPSGTVINCIIANNYGDQYAAIHSDGKVINTIFWNNKAANGHNDVLAYIGSSSSSSNNAAVSGSTLAKDAFTLNILNNNSSGPNFKAPTLFQGAPETPGDIAAMRAADWSFTAESPLIDKGTANDAPLYDITGTTRPKGLGFDLGAYEFDPTATYVAVESVEMSVKNITLEEESSQWLSVIISPSNATNKKLTWESLNPAIAKVENGMVTAISIGTATIKVTTVDGGKTDICTVNVIEKHIPYVHPDALAADQLNESDYTIPSFTKMLIAKQAVKMDSSVVNLSALQTSIQNLVNKTMPYTVVATINGNPSTQMGFAWFTNSDVMSGKIQLVSKANAIESDFTSPNFEINSTQRAVNGLNYAVFNNKVLAAANLPNGTKRNYRSHKVVATGLSPNTTYSYRVGFEGSWSEIMSFTTAKNSKDEFKFIYMTDTQVEDDEYIDVTRWAATAAANHATDSRFLLLPGDFVETGTAMNSEWEWEQLLEVGLKPTLKKFPVVSTDGNHDDSPNLNYTHHFNTDSSFNATAATKPQFHGINYSFVYGDALFIIHSYQDYWRTGYMNLLKTWFRSQAEANPNTKWRIAVVHKNLFTGSGHQPDADSKIFRQEMLPLFDELKIDFAIQGHDHVYEVIGPIDNKTKTLIPGSISDVRNVPTHSTLNVNGKEGGVYNVEGGTLYFINSTAGRKRYYPYTQAQMEAGFIKHEIPNYWNLFTGKFGQPGLPTFSEIKINSNEITVDTYTANQNFQTSLYDSFKIIKGIESGVKQNKSLNLLYPSIAKNSVNTTLTNIKKVLAVDIAGRSFDLPIDNQTIDVSKLNNGIYTIQLTVENKTLNSKLIINK